MARNTEYKFVSTDTDALVAEACSSFEKKTGIVLKPGSPEKLILQWVASLLVQERVSINRAANRNLASRAEGEDLDELGQVIYNTERPEAHPATTTIRFYISEAQPTAVLIPAGTRVTDINSTLFWQTSDDALVPIGATYADVDVECMTAGTAGNDYAIGQINQIVDSFGYFDHCENITVSGNGSDSSDDDAYYELMRVSMDKPSTAGAIGSYIFHAKATNNEISDVAVVSPEPCAVDIYLLMKDGTLANEEVKAAVLEACNEKTVRPLSERLAVKDAATVNYSINFTYYIADTSTIDASTIESNVEEAVENYIEWQSAKLGRDINPDKLRQYLYEAGIKRVNITAPTFVRLKNGTEDESPKPTPQLAKLTGTPTIINGGYEDE